MNLRQWAEEQKRRTKDEEQKKTLQVILDAIDHHDFPNLHIPSTEHSPEEAERIKKLNRQIVGQYAYRIDAKDAGDQLHRT